MAIKVEKDLYVKFGINPKKRNTINKSDFLVYFNLGLNRPSIKKGTSREGA